MIQRAQTIFLILGIIANLFLFNYNVWVGRAADKSGEIVEKVELSVMELHYVPKIENKSEISEIMYLPLILDIIINLLIVGTIFLYQNRLRQMIFVRLSMLLEAGLVAIFFYYVEQAEDYFVNNIADSHYQIGIFLPMAAVVFFFLANRFILRDEKRVRAADRLR